MRASTSIVGQCHAVRNARIDRDVASTSSVDNPSQLVDCSGDPRVPVRYSDSVRPFGSRPAIAHVARLVGTGPWGHGHDDQPEVFIASTAELEVCPALDGQGDAWLDIDHRFGNPHAAARRAPYRRRKTTPRRPWRGRPPSTQFASAACSAPCCRPLRGPARKSANRPGQPPFRRPRDGLSASISSVRNTRTAEYSTAPMIIRRHCPRLRLHTYSGARKGFHT